MDLNMVFSNDPVCTACKSLNCFINKYANETSRKLIAKKKLFSTYKKGELILRQGTPVTGIYFIHTGKVKVFITGKMERLQIVRLASSGNILGHRGIGNKLVYPISAAAMDKSKICFIPMASFLDALHRNTSLTLNLVMLYADEMKKSEYKLLYSNQMTVKQRIAHTLLDLHKIFGLTKVKGISYLNVPISRREISEIIGASIEEVIRTLSLLKKEGTIKIDSRKIGILNIESLRKLIAEFPSF